MRFATWNVNSIAARLPRLLEWLELVSPDVVCLQETKCAQTQFPVAELGALGYDSAAHGLGAWNGVAVISRLGIEDVVRGLVDEVGFEGPEGRALGATCGGVRFWSVYVPNGRALDHPHYQYKLSWMGLLRGVAAAELHQAPPLAICGDFNIAPTDADVWDPAAFATSTHVTPQERAALVSLLDLGLHDVVPRPMKHDHPFTYWDYRAGMFHKNMGMRIDLVYASPRLAQAVTDAYVDRDARKGKLPSDHAPIVVDVTPAGGGSADGW
ncbi:MAG: exodeoxyribonuclease III [Candidatus Dormibacteria bacterium]